MLSYPTKKKTLTFIKSCVSSTGSFKVREDDAKTEFSLLIHLFSLLKDEFIHSESLSSASGYGSSSVASSSSSNGSFKVREDDAKTEYNLLMFFFIPNSASPLDRSALCSSPTR